MVKKAKVKKPKGQKPAGGAAQRSSGVPVKSAKPPAPQRGNWKQSLAQVLAEKNSAKANGQHAGFATRDKRSKVLFRGFQAIRDMGYKIDDVRQLGGRHIEALCKHWHERGLAPATVKNNLSVFRVFSKWIGKAGLVRPSVSYFNDKAAVQVSSVATVDKSWRAADVDFFTKIEQVRLLDPRVAIQLELQAAFALRVNESWQLQPHLADKKNYLDVLKGTKGGRSRTVQIRNDYQRDVLNRAKEFAGRLTSTSDQARSLAQWKNRYYHIMEKAGITRKSGITSHGLRHERLNELYKEITGHASPIQGGKIVDRELHDFARQQVVQDAGHSNRDKSAAYIGSSR